MIRHILLIILQVCPSCIVVKFSCIARHIKFKNLSMLDHAEGSSANLVWHAGGGLAGSST